MDVPEWLGFVHSWRELPIDQRWETLFPALSPYLSSHPQVSPALTLDGPYSLGTQEANQGVERQDQLHREDHG